MKLISTEAFRSYVKHKEMTIREIADRAKVSPATVGHLHSGERPGCSPATAKAIARALDVPVNVLFVTRASTVSRDVPAGRAA